MTFCTNCGKKMNAGATKCEVCGARGSAAQPSGDEAAASSSDTSPDHLKTRISGGETTDGKKAPAPIVPPGSQTGRVLGGRYQLDACIGGGGMGEIYRARRLHIGDTVAVKVLRPDVMDNEKSRQRFYREARAAAMLHHPNAVVIHDFGEDDDGTAYIVMELLIGRSLRELLVDEGSISAVRAYGISRQACAALEAGHRNGIIHRDIKPDNIILLDSHDGADHIKILDFGIAKVLDKALDTLSLEQRLTNVGTVIGTPHYMAPEQCQGEEADARSDIYGLGIVLYELLTGVVPFVAKTPTGVAIKHVTEKPRSLRELNPHISVAVENVVLRALEKEPHARPQTALELAREFEAAVRNELRNEDSTQMLNTSAERQLTEKLQRAEAPTADAPLPSAAGQPLVAPPLSYDTVITPPTGTDSLVPAATDQLEHTATEMLPAPFATAEQRWQPADFNTKAITPASVPLPSTDKSPEPAAPRPTPAPVRPAPAPVGTAPAPALAPTPAKSRTPLLIGLGVLLLVLAGLGAWLSRAGDEPDVATNVAANASPTPTAATAVSPTPAPGYSSTNAPEGMVYVLGGVLRLGRDDGEENERPAHVVTVKPFFIDRTEVTNEQYQKFIAATSYAAPTSWVDGTFPAGAEQLPVTGVSWADATAYAEWIGKRLPTEEEWEFAARGSDDRRIYPWGEEWIENAANVKADKDDKRQLQPVGQYADVASLFDVHDLIGNAWEWTASDYRAYPGGEIETPPAGYKNLKVIRGGSYDSTAKYATATLRRGWPATRNDWPKNRPPDYGQTGFRCAQDARAQ